MRPQVVISKENPASQNIKSALLELFEPEQKEEGFWSAEGFDIAEYSGSIIEIVPSRDAEYYIFASTHKSKSNAKSLTVHTPGNWDAADMGGKPRMLNTALPVQLKAAAMEMARLAPALPGWQVSVEVDHHGPTLARPVMFAEIGSTENEWAVPEAGKIVAQSIAAAIACRQEFEVKIGFGGHALRAEIHPENIAGQSCVRASCVRLFARACRARRGNGLAGILEKFAEGVRSAGRLEGAERHGARSTRLGA